MSGPLDRYFAKQGKRKIDQTETGSADEGHETNSSKRNPTQATSSSANSDKPTSDEAATATQTTGSEPVQEMQHKDVDIQQNEKEIAETRKETTKSQQCEKKTYGVD